MAFKKNVYMQYGMVLIVPLAGLPNEGLRKKLNLKRWLSNLLRREVFFLRAARSNWGYLENAAVS